MCSLSKKKKKVEVQITAEPGAAELHIDLKSDTDCLFQSLFFSVS